MRLALLLIAWIGLVTIGGCRATPGSIVCEHCACYAMRTSVRRPVNCDTLGIESTCCALPSSSIEPALRRSRSAHP